MKKVVHILNTNSFSGAENVVITILNHLTDDTDYEVIYVSLDGEIKDFLNEYKLKYYFLDKMNILSLKKMINELKPDIIHCHDFTTSIFTACTFTRVPIVSHLHNNPLWIKNINVRSILYRLSLCRYKCVIGVSDAIFQEYIFSDKIKNKIVLSNPIDLSMIHSIDFGDKYDVIFLGRLTEQKDPLRFIEIIKSLKEKMPSIRAVMVGEGNLHEQCEEEIVNNGLQDHIDLVGFKKNRFDFISSSKIMCITSKWEGFGLMAIEGLALGKPVVSSHVGGLKKIVTNDCGKFCESNDEYVNEIYKLLNDSIYYSNKSSSALVRAKELENIDDYINKLKNIYGEI